jgi:hypothetical protein
VKVHRLSFGLKDTVSTPDYDRLIRDLTGAEPKGKGEGEAKGKPKGKDQGKSQGTDHDKGKGKQGVFPRALARSRTRPARRGL